MVKTLAPLLPANAQVLDVACGTGDLSIEFFEASKAKIIGLDFCRPMLDLAKAKTRDVQLIEGDALRLPFADGTFDAVNHRFRPAKFSSVEDGLRELRRILKPNGGQPCLSFPRRWGLRGRVGFYNGRVLPRLGGWLSGSRSAYEYLPDSISHFPNQTELAAMMRDAGFAEVKFENLTGGVAAVHFGRRAP